MNRFIIANLIIGQLLNIIHSNIDIKLILYLITKFENLKKDECHWQSLKTEYHIL